MKLKHQIFKALLFLGPHLSGHFLSCLKVRTVLPDIARISKWTILEKFMRRELP